MPRSDIEKALLVFALVLVIVGVYLVGHPSEGTVIRAGTPSVKWTRGTPARAEQVSRSETKLLGWVSIIMGFGLTWLVLRDGRR